MGFFSKLLSFFSHKKKVKIIMVGLDNSGKTTIMHWMKPKKKSTIVKEVTPTIGYDIETFEKKNFAFTVFDMSGQGKYRHLWEESCSDVDGIIFVIDSSDKIRFAVAKHELESLLAHKDLAERPVPVLFFANKMDLPGSCTAGECVDILDLTKITERSWHITSTNALEGIGIQDGLKWLIEKLEVVLKNKDKKK